MGPVLESGEKLLAPALFLRVFFFLITYNFPKLVASCDTGSGAVIHVRNHAYPIKKMSTIVVFQISDVYSGNILLVRSFLQTWPKKKWQGSSSVTKVACARAALAGDAPRLFRRLQEWSLQFQSIQHEKTHQV